MIHDTENGRGRLAGSSALVTGASRGIGSAIAVAFAREGADVAINYYSNDSAAAATADEARDAAPPGTDVTTVQADVSNEDAVDELFDTVRDRLGSPDVLVNNAGVLSHARVTDMSVDEWDRILDTNLRGTFLCTRRALDDMQAAGSGRIINVTSDLGHLGAEELAHYSASKGGMIAFTRAVAREAAPDVRVNAIAPGPIETEMLTEDVSPERQEEEADIPMQRVGEPEEVAPAAVFLASDDASFFTGQTLDPNGGSAMY
ncbi:SDR family NAD(P)-dependent oxidoreductase [Haloplanus litoreus]|uniref:SDR family NAD(P)-dependent oxidoreductase n=1 Tax=Haloplanus litoreus TaxID=767515 RepID=A0ABD5ZVI9_9EURY